MTTDVGPLGAPYRAIRAARARDHGPWAGVLVHTSEGVACVLVDAEVLGAEWKGWDAALDGHLLGARDVARRPDGHDVVLPVYVERLEDFVRRRAARMPLTAGEAVTLGVSVLRGCAEIAGSPDATGEWWLDDAGRPVLATDASPRRAFDASAAVLEQVDVDARMQRTWGTALRAVTADRVSVHELAAAEEALFAVATAEPLGTVSLSPRGAAEAVPGPQEAGLDSPARMALEPQPRTMWQTLLSGIDDDLAETVSRATTAVWRRTRAAKRSDAPSRRRAPWLLGGAVAAAVLTGGALWPAASGVATDDPAGPATMSTPLPTSSNPAADEVPPGARAATGGQPTAPTHQPGTSADLVQVVDALLAARQACGDASDCLASVVVDASGLPAGAVDLAADERTITLLDDFGDIAVLRVDANDAALGSQMVVILRRDEKWLLRDVSDVAQQP